MKYSKTIENDRRWVIPSLDVRLPQPPSVVNREPIRLWMVELTLTSGDVLNFYVKAKQHQDALVKAQSLQHIVSIPKLKRKFGLLD
jgi:hypothetical protein